MKFLIAMILTLLSQFAFAGNSANYHVLPGTLHSGGTARVEIVENSEDKYSAKLNYTIIKKILVPVPDEYLTGETTIALPPEFRDERGYMELETKGTMDIEEAKLKFVRREKFKNLPDAYRILILPKNGKSKIDVVYHPSLPAAGWGQVTITFISNIPVLNGYSAVIEID